MAPSPGTVAPPGDTAAWAQLSPAEKARLESEFRYLAQQIRCRQCEGQSVWESNAASAWEARAEIWRLLLEGKSREEILDTFVQRYGVWILARPPARGWYLLAWLAPLLTVPLGLWGIRRWLAAQGAPARAPAATGGETGPAPPGGGAGEAPEARAERDAAVEGRLREYL